MGKRRNKKSGKGFVPWWHRNKWRGFEVAIYVFVVLAMVMIYAIFSWSREIHWRSEQHIADYDALSAAGDFAAGTLGTIVAAISVFALFRTFAYQRRVTEATMQQTEMQRFNDLYFNLLGLYHKLVESLGTSADAYSLDKFSYLGLAAGGGVANGGGPSEPRRTGKLYIHYVRRCMNERFGHCKDIEAARSRAMSLFKEYYNLNPGQFGAYYRTIYRLLELLDEGNIPEEEKSSYSKILRAQFTESELFLLYYNSRTRLGEKMLRFVRKYHMLKHLPALCILEFRKYAVGLTVDEQAEVNAFYDRLYKALCGLTDWEGNVVQRDSEVDCGLYRIKCSVAGYRKKQPNNEIDINIGIKRGAVLRMKDYPTLRSWNEAKWEQVAKDFLYVMLPIARFSGMKCNLKVRTPRKLYMFFFFVGNVGK